MEWVLFFIFLLVWLVIESENRAKKKRVDDAYKGFNPQPVHGQRKFETDDVLKKAGLI